MTENNWLPSIRNIYGAIDDIILCFTQKHKMPIYLDYKGDDMRLIMLPNGNEIHIRPPKEDKDATTVIALANKSTGQWINFETNRKGLLKLLEQLLTDHGVI